MSWLLSRLARRTVWSLAVYLENSGIRLPPTGQPLLLLNSKRLMRGPWRPHTRADPFVFADGERLYLFYETQAADDPGEIEAAEITQGGWKPLGVVLKESFHLSYPAVFRHRDRVYMMPESQDSGELRLYRFEDFPRNPRLLRVMAQGRFADPSPTFRDGRWYIFATTDRGLEILMTDDLEHGTVVSHPMNPITGDSSVSRCGGLPFELDGQLIRPAQDGSGAYGANLHLMRVEEISPATYREAMHRRNLLDCDQSWNREGGHHVSIAASNGSYVIAVDGQAYDYYVHKFLLRAWLTVKNLRGTL